MGSIRKRLDRPSPWEAVYRDPEGRQRTKAFAKQADAKRFLSIIEADKLRGAYVDPAAGKVTFTAFSKDWLASQTVDAKTVEGLTSHLRAHLVPAFGTKELRHIRTTTVQRWLGDASKQLAPSYVRLLLSTLSAILGAAADDGIIARNPCAARSVTAPALEKAQVVPWTQAQVQLALDALPHRYRAPVVAAAGCGLRQGEAFGLRPCDVDFLHRRLLVRQQVKHVTGQGIVIAPPKRKKTRWVPLADAVAAAIAEHLAAYPADRQALAFTNTADGPINRGSFNSRYWKPAVAAAGLETTRVNGMHALRHYYASVTLEAGVSIRALAEYLGHKDPGFTLRTYTHLMPQSEDRAREAMDAAFGAVSAVDVSHL